MRAGRAHDCPDPDLLAGYFEGRLGAAEAARVAGHLRRCRACRAQGAAFRPRRARRALLGAAAAAALLAGLSLVLGPGRREPAAFELRSALAALPAGAPLPARLARALRAAFPPAERGSGPRFRGLPRAPSLLYPVGRVLSTRPSFVLSEPGPARLRIRRFDPARRRFVKVCVLAVPAGRARAAWPTGRGPLAPGRYHVLLEGEGLVPESALFEVVAARDVPPAPRRPGAALARALELLERGFPAEARRLLRGPARALLDEDLSARLLAACRRRLEGW